MFTVGLDGESVFASDLGTLRYSSARYTEMWI